MDSSPPTADAARPAGGAELALTWALYTTFAAAIVVTYSRLDPSQLYHVSEDGIDGGLGRALVFLNFPTALAAVPVLLVAADRLPRLRIAALLSIALCAVTALPGVVDQADLDAKPINLVPALGVAVAVALTLALVRSEGLGSLRPRVPGDRVRVAAAVVLVVTGIPWLFAELGFYADDVPGLGTVFMSDELRREADGTPIRAVHLGEHHGTDGMLLALTAIVLSRLTAFRSPRVRVAFTAYVALMLVYGVANHAQDGWLEQVVKRGWSDAHLPDVLRPEASAAWGVLLAAAAALYVVLVRNQRAPRRRLARRETSTEGS